MRPKNVPEFHPAQFQVSNRGKDLTQTVVWTLSAELVAKVDHVSLEVCTEESAICWPCHFSVEGET